MITCITFGIVIALSIALIAMGLIEDRRKEKHRLFLDTMHMGEMTVKEFQDYTGLKVHYDNMPIKPNTNIVATDGIIIRVGGVHIEGDSNED